MTKRKPKTASAVIHAHGGPADDFNMALLEQDFKLQQANEGTGRASASMARMLARQLREPTPDRQILDMVARWLDGDDVFKLVVVRRRSSKSWTKKVNDAAIAKALLQWLAADKPKYGMMKEIGDRFGVSSHKVRQVHKNLKAIRQRAIA